MFTQYEADIIVKGIEIYWTTLGKMREETLVTGDISYLRTNRDRGFERIFAVRIEGTDMDSQVKQMISDMKMGNLPDSMLITPNTRPENLAEILSQEGFEINGAAPCMMMSLDDYVEQVCNTGNITISDVCTGEQLKTWTDIVNTALFGCELATVEQFSDVYDLSNTHFYLGSYDGKPVTTCMTITDGDTSVLEMVATLQEYRGKGLATAVINKALIDLRKNGIRTISLRAEADGVAVYKRLGFKECFRRIVASVTE